MADIKTLPINLEVDDVLTGNVDSYSRNEEYSATVYPSPAAKDFRHENGRRYHAFDDDAYFLPNDETEAQRLDLQHHMWKLTFDGAFGWVPINNNMKRVLDVGTGTGIWAIEVANSFPDLQVTGTDLSPIQPDSVPSNCEFVIGNTEDKWPFGYEFDLIHARMLVMGMHDWPKFFERCFEHLEPGGWLDSAETLFPPGCASESSIAGSPFIRWGEYCYNAAKLAGIDARAAEGFEEMLRRAGFVNIERVEIQWPLGPWAKGAKNKAIGSMCRRNADTAMIALAVTLFTKKLAWTKESAEAFNEECLAELAKNPYYFRMLLHRAQKPPSS